MRYIALVPMGIAVILTIRTAIMLLRVKRQTGMDALDAATNAMGNQIAAVAFAVVGLILVKIL